MMDLQFVKHLICMPNGLSDGENPELANDLSYFSQTNVTKRFTKH